MSEENLLVVNSLLRVSMRFGEFSTDVYWARRDIEFVIVDGPEPGRWRGHDGLMDATIVWLSTWEEEHFEVDAICDRMRLRGDSVDDRCHAGRRSRGCDGRPLGLSRHGFRCPTRGRTRQQAHTEEREQ